jgi:glycosyltransferase involved in cell wall biosynthesis
METDREEHTSLNETEVPKKRIVLLSHYYWPEQIIFPPQVAEALRDSGYEVEVVTGYPNRPNGKIHAGYTQKLRFSEVINGIQVHRVPSIINHSRNPLERIANFISLSLSTLTMTRRAKDADLIYVYASPATIGFPAQVWRVLFRIPYVLHVQDLWPESVTHSGMMGDGRINRLAAKIMSPWLKRLYGKAAALIAISPGMRQVLIDRGNQVDRCSVAFNWAPEDAVVLKDRDSFSEDGLRLLYAGNLGIMQDLETVVDAAREFHTRKDFDLKIAGSGVMKETLQASAEDLDNVELLGQLSHSGVSELSLRSDFQLVTLKDLSIFRVTVPSKLQTSLAAGVPVITTVKGDVATLIQEYHAGIVAEPEDVESLVQAFETAWNMSAEERAQMGANARRLYEERMSHQAGTSAIAQVVAQAVEATSVGQSFEMSVERDHA